MAQNLKTAAELQQSRLLRAKESQLGKIGIAHGLLTGIAFWILGLPLPVLWGLVAAVASLIPVVGTGLVWVPAAAVLLLSGHWMKALILLACGGGIIAQIDAVVRPYIVSGHRRCTTSSSSLHCLEVNGWLRHYFRE